MIKNLIKNCINRYVPIKFADVYGPDSRWGHVLLKPYFVGFIWDYNIRVIRFNIDDLYRSEIKLMLPCLIFDGAISYGLIPMISTS